MKQRRASADSSESEATKHSSKSSTRSLDYQRVLTPEGIKIIETRHLKLKSGNFVQKDMLKTSFMMKERIMCLISKCYKYRLGIT